MGGMKYSALASLGDLPDWLAAERRLGTPLGIRRSYSPIALPSTYANSSCGKDWANGKWSAHSFAGLTGKKESEKLAIKDYVAEFIRGDHDATVAGWMRSIPKDGPFIDLNVIHEADAKVNKGIHTPATCIAAMQKLQSIVESRRAAGDYQAIHQVRTACCLTAYYWNPGNNSAANDKMDAMALTAESVFADAYGKGLYRATGLVDNFFDWCDAKGKMHRGLWEFSTQASTSETRPVWIEEMFRYCDQRDAEYIIGYNSNIGGSDPILSDDPSRDAYKSAVLRYTRPLGAYLTYDGGPTDGGGGDGSGPPPPLNAQDGMTGSFIFNL